MENQNGRQKNNMEKKYTLWLFEDKNIKEKSLITENDKKIKIIFNGIML